MSLRATQQIVGRERRGRELIADFQLPIVDLIRAAASTLPLGIVAMATLEQLIQQATTGKIELSEVESFCVAEGIEVSDLCNRIALIVAERFQAGTLSYEDGDGVMNALFWLIVENQTVEPAWSVYLAFDEGEYDHAGSTDPVESFTRPQIRKILDDAQQIVGREAR